MSLYLFLYTQWSAPVQSSNANMVYSVWTAVTGVTLRMIVMMAAHPAMSRTVVMVCPQYILACIRWWVYVYLGGIYTPHE